VQVPSALSEYEVLQAVHAPVKYEQALQLELQTLQMLVPGLYYPAGQVAIATHSPFTMV